MKILFVCENYLPHFGGAEVLFQHLAEGYVARGHQVTVLTHQMQGTGRKEEINGVQVLRVPSGHSRYLFTFAAARPVVSLARTHDLIQTTTFNGAPPAWLAARITHKPVVLTVHEVWRGKWQEITGFSWAKSMTHDFLERGVYALPFDRYVCVSQATQRDLWATGIPQEKTLQVYNGFDHEEWSRDLLGVKELPHWGTPGDYRFLACGRPGLSKGFPSLLEAFSLLRQKLPSALLLILGSPEQYPQNYQYLLRLIQEKHLQDSVTILTSVSQEELKKHYTATDAVVVPSLSEGFGYSAVRATALGKPVVVTDAGSLPEVVSGTYRIARKNDPRDLAEQMFLLAGGKGKKRKKKEFPWERTIEQYLEMYAFLLPGLKPPTHSSQPL